MRYDATEVRENTLKQVKKSELKSIVLVLMACICLYVVGSIYLFMDSNPKMSIVEVVKKHSIDALLLNHVIKDGK